MSNLLICPERPERIAHICSFVMSDLSDSLTVAHLSWGTWANRSHFFICPERFEQMSEWAMSKWANSQSWSLFDLLIRNINFMSTLQFSMIFFCKNNWKQKILNGLDTFSIIYKIPPLSPVRKGWSTLQEEEQALLVYLHILLVYALQPEDSRAEWGARAQEIHLHGSNPAHRPSAQLWPTAARSCRYLLRHSPQLQVSKIILQPLVSKQPSSGQIQPAAAGSY